MWIEIDDQLFLPRDEVVGLQFPSAEEFERCQALLWTAPFVECYREVSPLSLVVVVRKSDRARFEAAGLTFRTFEWEVTAAQAPADAVEPTQVLIAQWMPAFVERLRHQRPSS
jgi:hypothetical protein